MLLQKVKQVFLCVLAGILLFSGNTFAQESGAEESGASETEAAGTAEPGGKQKTAQEEEVEQQYRIDYMDEIEWYDSGKFMDGFTVQEREVRYKASIDLLFDLGIYFLEEDYEAVKNGTPVNTNEIEYSKYEKSVTYADLYYVLNQIITQDMELSEEYKKAGSEERVTMQDALRYMADLLGYGMFKETVGMEKIVSDNRLLNGVSGYQAEKHITFGELSMLLLNTFEAYGVEQSYSGEALSIAPAKEKFMERQLDIYKTEGFVNAVGALNIFKNQPLRPGEVEIDRKKYNAGNSGAEDYLGKIVVAYFYAGEDDDILRHVYVHKRDESLTADLHDVEYSQGKFVLYNGIKEYKRIDSANIQYVLYNGVSSQDLSVLDEIEGKDGTLLLSSSSRDGVYDIVIINTYAYFVAYSVNPYDQRIYFRDNAELNGANYLELENFEEIVCTQNNQPVDYTTIPSGAVLRILACPENRYIQMTVFNEPVNGKIEAMEEKNRVRIAGKEYWISETYRSNPQNIELTVGENGLFYVSADGYIAGYKRGNEMSYAYLYRVIQDELTEDVLVELFTQDGTWEKYTVKEKNAEIDGIRRTAASAYTYLTEGNVRNSVCRYKINSNNEITFLDTLLEEPTEKQDENRMRFAYEGNVRQSWFCEWFRSDIGYRVRPSSIVFQIPKDVGEKENFAVKSGSNLNQDEQTIYMELYNPNSMNVCDVVVIGESREVLSNEVRQVFYCENISGLYDEAQEEVCYEMNGKLFMTNQGIGEETSYSLKVSLQDLEQFEKNYPGAIQAGTVMNFTADADGYVTAIEPWVYNNEIPADFHNKDNPYYQRFAGKITAVDMDEGYFSVTAAGSEIISSLSCCICIDAERQKARSIGIGELIVGERIYVNRTAGGARFAVVIR